MAEKQLITFIDLFAGIGGIRFGFEAAHACCVFSCEWDKFARQTYLAFHGDEPEGDINDIPLASIPDHDILTAGFPCQSFSLAGVSKRNSLGRDHGFEDPTYGTLFFNIKQILRAKQPRAFLLENVKHLRHHDGGKTFEIIEQSLEEVGYDFDHDIIDSAQWVPQHRERVYIVGYRKDLGLRSELGNAFPEEGPPERPSLSEILQSPEAIEERHGDRYTLGPGTWRTLKRHKRVHREAGNGFGYGMLKPPFGDDVVTRTLSARYHKDGAEILIYQGEDRRPRRLTPLEVCRLQGFPNECESFFDGTREQPVSDTQAYRQFGNSVTVPVIREIARRVVRPLAQ